MRYADLVQWFETKSGHSLNADEGLRCGIPRDPLGRIMLCWMVTVPAAEEARRWGADLILSHEAVFHPYYLTRKREIPEEFMSWKANVERLRILMEGRIAVMRGHGSADDTGFLDAFLEAIGMEGRFEGSGYARVCSIPPTSVRDVALCVKRNLGMEGLRVAARDLDAAVSRIGFPYGGGGLQLNMPSLQRLIESGCDAVIAGESDSYAMQFALDSGIALIETSHEESENPGLRRLTEQLAQAFPDSEFRFFETKRPFVIL